VRGGRELIGLVHSRWQIETRPESKSGVPHGRSSSCSNVSPGMLSSLTNTTTTSFKNLIVNP
jgi:hypothetical protein